MIDDPELTPQEQAVVDSEINSQAPVDIQAEPAAGSNKRSKSTTPPPPPVVSILDNPEVAIGTPSVVETTGEDTKKEDEDKADEDKTNIDTYSLKLLSAEIPSQDSLVVLSWEGNVNGADKSLEVKTSLSTVPTAIRDLHQGVLSLVNESNK